LRLFVFFLLSFISVPVFSSGLSLCEAADENYLCKPAEIYFINNKNAAGSYERFKTGQEACEDVYEQLGELTRYSQPRYEFNGTWGTGCWFYVDSEGPYFYQNWAVFGRSCPEPAKGYRQHRAFTDPNDTDLYNYNGTVGCAYEKLICPEPSVLEGDKCVERCPIGADPVSCSTPPEINTCADNTSNPINLFKGYKLRRETVYESPISNGINFVYHYNNQGNSTFGPNGRRQHSSVGTVIVKSYPPIWEVSGVAPSLSSAVYPSFSKVFKTYNGDGKYYWRHSYQDYLHRDATGKATWIRPNGFEVVLRFNDQALNASGYKYRVINSSDGLDFSGYAIVSNRGDTRFFDNDGRLRALVLSSSDVHEVLYAENKIIKILHKKNGVLVDSISLEYENQNGHGYLSKMTSLDGFVSLFSWDRRVEGYHVNQNLLTKIVYPDSDGDSDLELNNNPVRMFEYNNDTFPVSITEIYDKPTQGSYEQSLVAEFRYDEYGRAIYSGLVNGVDAVSVDYTSSDQRVVTNALGGKTYYNYQSENGTRFLKSIEGETSSTCAGSSHIFEYDGSGKLVRTVSNDSEKEYYYSGGKVSGVIDDKLGANRSEYYFWDESLDRILEVYTNKMKVFYQYDSKGRIISIKTLSN
jgi:YD repeat-containing protein